MFLVFCGAIVPGFGKNEGKHMSNSTDFWALHTKETGSYWVRDSEHQPMPGRRNGDFHRSRLKVPGSCQENCSIASMVVSHLLIQYRPSHLGCSDRVVYL